MPVLLVLFYWLFGMAWHYFIVAIYCNERLDIEDFVGKVLFAGLLWPVTLILFIAYYLVVVPFVFVCKKMWLRDRFGNAYLPKRDDFKEMLAQRKRLKAAALQQQLAKEAANYIKRG